MIPKKFMISVIWGAGMHYFSGGDDDYQEAVRHANVTLGYVTKVWERAGSRGARPAVHVWQGMDRLEMNSGEATPTAPV